MKVRATKLVLKSMSVPTLLAVVVIEVLLMMGCQTLPYQPYAREVKRLPGKGGEIALKAEHRDEDRAKAQTVMASNCGNLKLKILEEGEVVVGQTTNSNATEVHNRAQQGTTVGSFFGVPITSGEREASNNMATTATTMALKEWNIKYECTKL